jgi:hypothetical protein
MAVVSVNKKFGYIDQKGKLVVPIIFDNAIDYSEGLGAVKYRDTYLFLDQNARERIEISRSLNNQDKIMVKVLDEDSAKKDSFITSIDLD